MAIATLFLLAALAASDISGTWQFTVETAAGTGNPTFTFKQEGEKLTGTYEGLLGKADVSGTVKGDEVEFSFEGAYEGQKFKVRYRGKILDPASMKGTAQFAEMGEASWTAAKKKT